MRSGIGAAVGLALMVVGSAAWTQPAPGRAMQMGVKTSDVGYAATAEVSVKAAEMGRMNDMMEQALKELLAQIKDAGFTPLGPVQAAITSETPPGPEAKMTFQLQLPLMQQPSEEDLKGGAGIEIVKLEARKVAYTYHEGALTDLDVSFQRLFEWLTAEKHTPNGPPRVIIYNQLNTDPMKQTAELQVPIG